MAFSGMEPENGRMWRNGVFVLAGKNPSWTRSLVYEGESGVIVKYMTDPESCSPRSFSVMENDFPYDTTVAPFRAFQVQFDCKTTIDS